jgi:hypothetical protein
MKLPDGDVVSLCEWIRQSTLAPLSRYFGGRLLVKREIEARSSFALTISTV